MKKVQVEILTDGVRLDGIDKSLGEIVELPQSLLKTWEEKGYCRLKKAELDEVIPPKVEDPKNEEPKLNHVGGGYYQLPNGEKVKGKAAAIEAIKALKGGEENGTKINSGSNDGTGNNTGSGD